MCIKFRLENLNGRDHLKDLDIEMRIILKWILGMCGLVDWFLGWGPLTGSFEHFKEPSVSLKGKKFLD
jgi:hypothetical protein